MLIYRFLENFPTLRAKFLAIVLPLVGICFGLYAVGYGLVTYDSLRREQVERVEAFAEVQSRIIALALWNLDYGFLRDHIDSLVVYPWVSRAILTEFASESTITAGELPEDLSADHILKVTREVDIVRKETRYLIGRLTIISRTDMIRDALLRDLLRDSQLVALLVLAIIASAVAANRLTIGRPLDLLVTAIRQADARGERRPVRWASRDEMGQVIGAYNSLVANLSARETALRRSEEKYRNIFERVAEGIFRSTPDGRFVEANPAMARLFDYDTPGDLIRKVTDIGRQIYIDPEDRDRLLNILRDKGVVYNYSREMRRKDGQTIWVEISARAVTDEAGRIRYIEGIASDVTERKVCEIDLHHQATIDELTAIPNRFLFRDRLRQAMLQADRNREEMALLYLDLDYFKMVNDTLGHHAGDEVLRRTACRIQDRLRKSDTVARLGGDEFCIIVRPMGDPGEAGKVAEKIIESIRIPHEMDGNVLTIGTSIGIAIYPRHGETGDDLLQKADLAMFRAKQRGRNQYAYWNGSPS